MTSTVNPSIQAVDEFRVEEFVPFRLLALASRMTRAAARIYLGHFSLSASEWRGLAVLGRFGAMATTDLAERTGMDKVRVSRAVTRLMELGYVARQTDPNDRRRAFLSLTASGATICSKIVPRALAVEAELLASLTAEERAALAELISKLENRVGSVLSSVQD